MSEHGFEKQQDRFEGLSDAERGQLQSLETTLLEIWGNTPQALEDVKFNVEHERVAFLMNHALTDLKNTDYPTYLRIIMAVRATDQRFLDAINKYNAANPDVEHQSADQTINDPSDLRFSELFARSGFRMRAEMIEWLSAQSGTRKLVGLLRELQKLLPAVRS